MSKTGIQKIMLPLTLILCLPVSISSIKVISTTENWNSFTKTSVATLTNPPQVSLTDVSICFRFYEFRRLEEAFLVSSMMTDDFKTTVIRLYFSKNADMK